MSIGFIGCGNMASAMISGMLKKGLYKKDEIIVSNLSEEGSKRSKEKLGVVTTLDNHEVVKNTKNAAEKLRNNPLVSCTECMNDHAFRQR